MSSTKDFDLKHLQELLNKLDSVAAAKDALKMLEHATDVIACVMSFPGISEEVREELVNNTAKSIGAVGRAITVALGCEMPEAEYLEGIELAKIMMHEKIEHSIKEQEKYGNPEILVVDLSQAFKQNVRHN